MLDLWLLWFSASYSTLAQFMMNYGNEWDHGLDSLLRRHPNMGYGGVSRAFVDQS